MKQQKCSSCNKYKNPDKGNPKCYNPEHSSYYYDFEWSNYCNRNDLDIETGKKIRRDN